jgi:hypothetical protein
MKQEVRMVFTNRSKLLSVFIASTVAMSPSLASATVIDLTPLGSVSQQVAANVPSFGNTWTGVAQSFVTPGAKIRAGMYMFAQTGATVVRLSLLNGDGPYGTLLGAIDVDLPQVQFYEPALVEADFTNLNLTPNSQYTLVASLPSGGYPSPGTYSVASILYHSVNNAYAGGRFYYTGSPYDTFFGFADRDIAIRITPASAAIPEPTSWVMMISGFGLVGTSIRRQRKLKLA